ncbi:MAG: polysaccharide deacetylase family protein [Candidatus Rokubacteria bacterium]|nr:polysaccharide deacetylase family protein [Candidatus Rokubacteria bacterium]
MRHPRERYDYSATVDRKPLKLPKGARVAVWTIVNVEEWDIEKPMPRTVLSPPQGTGGIPDVPNWAWHEYGMRAGFWRLKAALDKHKVKATMAINASVCLTYPRIAEAALQAGWEFMGHGFVQGSMHLLTNEREAIRKSVETIKKFTGKPPRGWLGPGLTETWQTLDILAEEGIEYVSDWVNDDQPYEIKTTARPLVMVPYSLEINDIPMMLIQHHEAHELFDRARDQFDRLYEEARHSARIMAIAVHPYISGVPHRIKYFEKIYAYMKKRPGVLFWRGEDILDWYRRTRERR